MPPPVYMLPALTHFILQSRLTHTHPHHPSLDIPSELTNYKHKPKHTLMHRQQMSQRQHFVPKGCCYELANTGNCTRGSKVRTLVTHSAAENLRPPIRALPQPVTVTNATQPATTNSVASTPATKRYSSRHLYRSPGVTRTTGATGSHHMQCFMQHL